MGFIASLLGYVLNFIYNIVQNYGWSIIIFSVLLRLVLLPFTIKQQKTMKKTAKVQEEMNNLQIKYKNDPEKLNRETIDLYKREKISPFSGCLSSILQLVLFLSVFYLVSRPLTYMKNLDDVMYTSEDVTIQNEVTEENAEGQEEPVATEVSEESQEEVAVAEENAKGQEEPVATEVSEGGQEEAVVTEENAEGQEEPVATEVSEGSQEEVAVTEENAEGQEEPVATEVSEGGQEEAVATEENAENQEENVSVIEHYENELKKENNGQNSSYTEIEIINKYRDKDERVNINMDFLGLDLSKIPMRNLKDIKVYIIPLLYILTTFINIKISSVLTKSNNKKKENSEKKVSKDGEETAEEQLESMQQMTNSMNYMMPIMSIAIAIIAPLGLSLYWLVSNSLQLIERLIINKVVKDKQEMNED